MPSLAPSASDYNRVMLANTSGRDGVLTLHAVSEALAAFGQQHDGQQ